MSGLYIWLSWLMLWLLIWRFSREQEVAQSVIWKWLIIKTLGALTIATSWLAVANMSSLSLLPLIADWLWTTPITLIVLWRIAYFNVAHIGVSGQAILARLLWSCLLMLALGMMAERAVAGVRWVLLSLAIACFTYLLVLLWHTLYRQAQYLPRRIYRMFVVSTGYVSATWLWFPSIWVISPLGFDLLTTDQALWMLYVGHVIVKVGFFLLLFTAFTLMSQQQANAPTRKEPLMS